VEQGTGNVLIVAIWLGGQPRAHDAFAIAQALPFGSFNPFLHGVLVHEAYLPTTTEH
jgi:hypothetical protein